MTKIEIIEDTVAYYSVDPDGRRAIKDLSLSGGCFYYKEIDGVVKMCALGRFMKNPEDFSTSGAYAEQLLNAFPDCLREQDHDAIFWRDVQKIHDNNLNWIPTGLSEIGIEFVEELKTKYKNK